MNRVMAMMKRYGVALLAFIVVGCATAYAPGPSPKLLTASQTALTQGLGVLEGMSGGVEAGGYEGRADAYSELLAQLRSIVVLIKSRPPGADLDQEAIQEALAYAERNGVPIPSDALDYPNLKAAENAVREITDLRDIDMKKDCGTSAKCPTNTQVKLAMSGFETAMSGVIYYEQLLVNLKEDD